MPNPLIVTTLDLYVGVVSSEAVIVPLGNANAVRVQARQKDTAWATAVIAVKWSNEATGPWSEFPGGNVRIGPPTSGGTASSDLLDVSGMGYICLEPTTAESGESVAARVWGCEFAD